MKKFILEFIDVKALHDSYYGSGKLMLRALKKYGKENFKREYLHVFNDDQWELAFAKEKEYVTRDFTLRDDTYNLSEGGSVNPVMYGENNPFYGKKHTQETIDKIQDSRSWYEMTDETKEKISEGGKEVWKREGYKEKMVYIYTQK